MKEGKENFMTHLKENKGVKYLTYSLFEELDFIYHASSTRIGGVSEGELGAMNFGASTRDSKQNIRENYRIFSNAVGIRDESIVTSSQFHNANIKVCSYKDRGAGVIFPMPYSDMDGLVTNEKDVTLCIFSADCIPILFADPVNKCIGACHCGWKGTIKDLAKLTVEKLSTEYGADPKNMKVVIAPGIKKCCYEVSEELYRDFENKYHFNDGSFEIKDNKYYLDLPLINKNILLSAGILKENIYISDLCTCCNSELLHSHRATKGKRGIMGHFIGIKNQT